jgi:hypothetical protein
MVQLMRVREQRWKGKRKDWPGKKRLQAPVASFWVAFAFIGEMFPRKEETEETLHLAESLKSRLADCLEKDENGRLKMTITLPDESVLNNLAKSLAQILGQGLKQ